MAIPSITPYTGQTPDKATQTKEAFADNVYATHLFYDNSFVSEMNLVIDATNEIGSFFNSQITMGQYKGDWLVGSTYAVGEAVSYGGYWYLSKVAGNIGHTPPVTEDTYWKKSMVIYTAGGGGGTTNSFTAGANLTAGAPISILSDGTAVETTEAIGGLSLGTSYLFSSGTIANVSSCYDTTNNKLVVFYYDSVAANSYGVVGTVTGTSISWGTPVSFLAGTATYVKCTFDSTNNKTVTLFADGLNAGNATVIIGTVAGTAISFGTKVQVATVAGIGNSIAYDVTQNRVVCLVGGGTATISAYAGLVSGTSITFGTGVALTSSVANYGSSIVSVESSKFVAITSDDVPAKVFASVITIAASVVTVNTSVEVEAAIYTSAPHLAYDSTNGVLLLAYKDMTNTLYKLVTGSVSATSTTWGTPVNISATFAAFMSISHNAQDGLFYVSGRQPTTLYATVATVTVSAGVPSLTNSVLFTSTANSYSTLTYDPDSLHVILSYQDSTTVKAP